MNAQATNRRQAAQCAEIAQLEEAHKGNHGEAATWHLDAGNAAAEAGEYRHRAQLLDNPSPTPADG